MEPRSPPRVVVTEDDDGITVQDIAIPCSDGMILTGQIWRRKRKKNHQEGLIQKDLVMETTTTTTTTRNTIRILCLHGFLDNCRSFATLAPRLLAYHQPTQISSSSSSGKMKQDYPPPPNKLQNQQQHQQQRTPASSSSFSEISDIELLAFDFPGHGQSTHFSFDQPPMFHLSTFVVYVSEIIERIQWVEEEPFILIGHSIGAIISCLYTGTFPEHIQHLILLDGNGPEYESSTHVVQRLHRHVLQRYEGNQLNTTMTTTTTAPPPPHHHHQEHHHLKESQPLPPREGRHDRSTTVVGNNNNNRSNNNNKTNIARKSTKKTYHSLQEAIQTRQRTAMKSPGSQWLSEEAAKEMVLWALEEVVVVESPAGEKDQEQDKEEGGSSNCGTIRHLGWQFRHDPRLHWTTLQVHVQEQALDFWTCIRNQKKGRNVAAVVRTLWLRAKDGWPFPSQSLKEGESILGGGGSNTSDNNNNNNNLLTVRYLPGSHHFHLDLDTVDAVATSILEYLVL